MLLSRLLRTISALGLIAAAIGQPASATNALGGPSASSVEHKVYGTVESLNGNTLVIRTRTGQFLTVDGHLAQSHVLLRRNRPVIVFGTTDAAGVMHARAVWRTFPDAAHWPPDR